MPERGGKKIFFHQRRPRAMLSRHEWLGFNAPRYPRRDPIDDLCGA